jgi:tRNA-dihydrouridine synthase A
MNRRNIRLSVAPMMDWTDRHCRYFLRLLSPSSLLYTEMVTAAAIVHGDADRFLRFNNEEHPIALQLGGSNPNWMAQATAKATAYGYDEININVGCPSDRVQSGQFGACLMAAPDLVADCFKAMQKETDIPITVRFRRAARGGRLPQVHRACAHRDPGRTEPQGEPYSPASQLRTRLSAETRLSRTRDCH